VEALSPHFDFYILTLNRDFGSNEIYSSVRTSAWNRVGAAHVYYTPDLRFSAVRRAVDEVRPDVLYLNGFFAISSLTGLVLRRVGGLPSELPVVLATRGELAPGALGLKAAKKRAFTILARAVGLYDNLRWHASSEQEKSEMLRLLGSFGVRAEHIHVAPNLGVVCPAGHGQRSPKVAGEASFVTVSRVSRMKNLPFTLDRLAEFPDFHVVHRPAWAGARQGCRERSPRRGMRALRSRPQRDRRGFRGCTVRDLRSEERIHRSE
jgi:hypothetical protein